MCGRYVIHHSTDELQALFGTVNPERFEGSRHYNIAPTSLVPMVYSDRNGERAVGNARWGLVPHWVEDPASWRAASFNARSEEAPRKPAFREAFRRGRVLVPASGFYEWSRRDGRRAPHYIRRRDGLPLAFAGIMDVWRSRDGSRRIVSLSILTTRPNGVVGALHERMPVILEAVAFDAWLDRDTAPARIGSLLAPCPDPLLDAYEVSRGVNSARSNDPSFVDPVV